MGCAYATPKDLVVDPVSERRCDPGAPARGARRTAGRAFNFGDAERLALPVREHDPENAQRAVGGGSGALPRAA